jgi:Mn2+/Fe2+ NRAMP family transporter
VREIFLGKPWHWALIMVIVLLLWLAGTAKLHVIHFNTFLIALCVGTVAVILLVLRTTKPGEQITRDVIEESSADETFDPGD